MRHYQVMPGNSLAYIVTIPKSGSGSGSTLRRRRRETVHADLQARQWQRQVPFTDEIIDSISPIDIGAGQGTVDPATTRSFLVQCGLH